MLEDLLRQLDGVCPAYLLLDADWKCLGSGSAWQESALIENEESLGANSNIVGLLGAHSNCGYSDRGVAGAFFIGSRGFSWQCLSAGEQIVILAVPKVDASEANEEKSALAEYGPLWKSFISPLHLSVRSALRAELLKLVDELVESKKSNDDLLNYVQSMVSLFQHDMGNFLNVLSVSLVSLSSSVNDSVELEIMRLAITKAQELNRCVQQIYEQPLEKGFNAWLLDAMVEECAPLWRLVLRGKQLSFSLGARDARLCVPKSWIARILLNLLLNSVRAGASHTVIETNVYADPSDGKPYITISVSDNGRGIGPDVLALSFTEMIARLEITGSGRGLRSVNEFCRRANSHVTFEASNMGGLLVKMTFSAT